MPRIPLASAAATLLLVPWGLAAQSGTVTYERSVTRTRAALVGAFGGEGRPGAGLRPDAPPGGRAPGGRIPGAAPGGRAGGGPLQEYATLTVHFDGTTALTLVEPMASGEGAGPEGGPPGGGPAGRRFGGGDGAGAARLQAGLRAGGLPGMPIRTTSAVWVDAASGEKVEAVDFMTREFRVVSEIEPLSWRLQGEESEYLGYVVQKAVAERDSATIEAWFTVEVPGFAAPEDYTGLPGVVLMVSVNRGETLIQAVDVRVDGPAEAVARPADGQEISSHDFDALVAEKTEEFRAEMQSRRRGGGGGA